MNNLEQNTLQKLLLCPICNKRLEDPYQCSFCSKPICKLCLEKWLKSNSICPICKEEIGQNLCAPKVVKSIVISSILSVQPDLCSKHNEENEFYCVKCEKVICKICAFLDLHKKHNILLSKDKLSEVKGTLEKVEQQRNLSLDQIKKEFYSINQIDFLSSQFKLAEMEQHKIMEENEKRSILSKEIENHIINEDELLVLHLDELVSEDTSIDKRVSLSLKKLKILNKTENSKNIISKLQQLKEMNVDKINPPCKKFKCSVNYTKLTQQKIKFNIWENNGILNISPFIYNLKKMIKIGFTFQFPIDFRVKISYLTSVEKKSKTIDLIDSALTYTSQEISEYHELKEGLNQVMIIILISPLNYYSFCEQMMYYTYSLEQKLKELGQSQYDKLQNKQELGTDGEVLLKKIKLVIDKKEDQSKIEVNQLNDKPQVNQISQTQ